MENDVKINIIVSEDVESQNIANSGVSRTIIINPVGVLRSMYIPTSLSLGVTIVVSSADWTIPHKALIQIINPRTEKVIFDSGYTDINANTIQKNIDNFSFTVELKNIGFEDEGSYEVVFELDEKKTTHEFKVLKVGS